MNVFDDEYWLQCYHFPNYQVSSWGRLKDTEFDEIVIQGNIRSVPKANLKYGPDEFRGEVWRMMYATFWQAGWGIGVDISYRDGDSTNINMFNFLFSKDGKPLLYTLNESTGVWAKRKVGTRRVMVVESGEEFDSVNELAQRLELDRNAVYMCLRGVQISHHGLTFKYLD